MFISTVVQLFACRQLQALPPLDLIYPAKSTTAASGRGPTRTPPPLRPVVSACTRCYGLSNVHQKPSTRPFQWSCMKKLNSLVRQLTKNLRFIRYACSQRTQAEYSRKTCVWLRRQQYAGLDQANVEGFELGRVEVDKKCREIVAKGFQVGCLRLGYFSSDTGADRSVVALLIYLVQCKYSRLTRASGNVIPAEVSGTNCLLMKLTRVQPRFSLLATRFFSTICRSRSVEACNIANHWHDLCVVYLFSLRLCDLLQYILPRRTDAPQ